MFKNQKGITLIALVITIIVLLILAGITIALITANDSAPQKAGEAKITQDMGAAKDAVALNAAELLTTHYENKYVTGVSTTGYANSAQKDVAVADLVKNLPSTITATTTNLATDYTFTLSSTEKNSAGKKYYQEGTVTDKGTVTWDNPSDSDKGWK